MVRTMTMRRLGPGLVFLVGVLLAGACSVKERDFNPLRTGDGGGITPSNSGGPCSEDADCNDNNDCNGIETCDPSKSSSADGCLPGREDLPDAMFCAFAGDENRPGYCLRAQCIASECGDSFTDVNVGEECDDGKDGDPDDGCTDECTFSCTVDEDCEDDNICDGRETCTDAMLSGMMVRRCAEGNLAADGTPCAGTTCCSGDCCGAGTVACCTNGCCTEFCDGEGNCPQ